MNIEVWFGFTIFFVIVIALSITAIFDYVFKETNIKEVKVMEVKQTVGQVIEALISIKDDNKDNLSNYDINAINNACNILDHNFNSMILAEKAIEGEGKND